MSIDVGNPGANRNALATAFGDIITSRLPMRQDGTKYSGNVGTPTPDLADPELIYGMPIFIPNPVEISALYFSINATAVGVCLAYMGIYEFGPDGELANSGAPIAEADPVDATATDECPIDFTFPHAGHYLIALKVNEATGDGATMPEIQFINGATVPPPVGLGSTSASAQIINGVAAVASASISEMPDPFAAGGIGTLLTNQTPVMGVITAGP